MFRMINIQGGELYLCDFVKYMYTITLACVQTPMNQFLSNSV